jgi:hypothetical protein
VWSWRPDAGVKSAGFFLSATVAKEPGHRGEHEGNRKTIARGKPVELVVPVVTTLVWFFYSHARLRVQLAPGFPCALDYLGERLQQTSGVTAPRDREGMSQISSVARMSAAISGVPEGRKHSRISLRFAHAGYGPAAHPVYQSARRSSSVRPRRSSPEKSIFRRSRSRTVCFDQATNPKAGIIRGPWSCNPAPSAAGAGAPHRHAACDIFAIFVATP